jgi:hypothetical protein
MGDARMIVRGTCETCPSIDVRQWHRSGHLRSGLSFAVSWTIDGKPYGGGLHVRIAGSVAILNYQIRTGVAPEPNSVEQEIPIVGTTCNFGGARPWFQCVPCNRRAAKLFLGPAGFRCRRCYGLSYEVQLEPLRLRGLARARKIRARLGADANLFNDLPPRPKGMHRSTFARLSDEYALATMRCGAGQISTIASSLDRLLSGMPMRRSRSRR